ncbi:ubiquinone anaerobic biosynthesis protein UbiU [Pelagibaculum spongiae]|uniref:Ubiquinone biosynthesis protein UbiU n=1 Tax=Pelagibaculum spongiae TaxID=2080658 RepID=A0A2V1GZY2_9GAMM|nr:peptidase U32 family protein [Pelagibaculum spongiae]PVZ68972.1 protease [Pelagibaculum spongiae]
MELVCPAGSLPALKAAVDEGADAVYIGFKDDTNARHFAGLNLAGPKLKQAVDYVKKHDRRIFVAINTYASEGRLDHWKSAVDKAADLGVDALILADVATLEYAAKKHPNLSRHLSVQGSATNKEALNLYHQHFGIKRAILPRVLSIAQVKHLCQASPVELEVFGFGSLCIMAEGRCHLSSYMTGESPNCNGCCSPASHVRWQETEQGLECRLNDVLIDRYKDGENAGYPTLCKGRFEVDGNIFHALEEPTSLNTMDLLPELRDAGVCAIKLEGRQRSPAYAKQVTGVWRHALDRLGNHSTLQIEPQWTEVLDKVSEGSQTTIGPYHRSWQ